MISKKELLQLTNISYGQLYRWKREGLIPEEWFVKMSVTTGQETFFDEDLIVPRVTKILSLKDDYSIDEIKSILNPEASEINFYLDKLKDLECFDKRILKSFVNDKSELNINEVVVLYALSLARRDVDKLFFDLNFDLTLSDFKDFEFNNAKMALIYKKREGHIVFFNENIIVSDKNLTVKIYELDKVEAELLEIIKIASYKN